MSSRISFPINPSTFFPFINSGSYPFSVNTLTCNFLEGEFPITTLTGHFLH